MKHSLFCFDVELKILKYMYINFHTLTKKAQIFAVLIDIYCILRIECNAYLGFHGNFIVEFNWKYYCAISWCFHCEFLIRVKQEVEEQPQ